MKTITASEFKARSGRYLDESGKEPVYITRHDRPVRVLVDVEEYERLRAIDTRKYYDLRTDDLPEEFLKELEKGDQGEPTPHLDHLME